MSGDARISGRIVVDPPITWPELAGRPELVAGDWKPDGTRHADAKVDVNHRDIDTDQGVLSARLGTAIIPEGGETSGYTLVASVQRIVDVFGTAPNGARRTFRGWLRMAWVGGGDESVSRVHVVGGRAVESQPALVWPDGARDEDGAE